MRWMAWWIDASAPVSGLKSLSRSVKSLFSEIWNQLLCCEQSWITMLKPCPTKYDFGNATQNFVTLVHSAGLQSESFFCNQNSWYSFLNFGFSLMSLCTPTSSVSDNGFTAYSGISIKSRSLNHSDISLCSISKKPCRSLTCIKAFSSY